MAEFLKITALAERGQEKQPLLSEISTRQAQKDSDRKSGNDDKDGSRSRPAPTTESLNSPEDVLQVLRSDPTEDVLLKALKILSNGNGFETSFSIHVPGPIQAKIINTLVETTVPTFWPTSTTTVRSLLLSCLGNVAGVAALVARIKQICLSAGQQALSKSNALLLHDLITILDRLLKPDAFIADVWTALTAATDDTTKLRFAWKEFVATVASGKVLGTIAQVEDVLRATDHPVRATWLSTGPEYARWLGRSLASLCSKAHATQTSAPDSRDCAAQLLQKGLLAGYPVPMIKGIMSVLCADINAEGAQKQFLTCFDKFLPAGAKRQFMNSLLRWLSITVDSDDEVVATQTLEMTTPRVSAIAAALAYLVGDSPAAREILLEFLGDPNASSSVSFLVRRAAAGTIADLAGDDLEPLLEKAVRSFGDPLFINHANAHQQESLAQTILLTAGYLHRITPMAVLMAARSSNHMQGVSSRLDSSNQRARWLGMVMGTALSGLVDKPGSKMSFGTDELETDEAKWYLSLVNIKDSTGSLKDLADLLKSQEGVVARRRKPQATPKTREMPILNGKRVFGPVRPPSPVQTEVVGDKIAEIDDDDEDDGDDDLKPYAKPDSDPEDSDEDATLVNRKKPRPPVYIRDLMAMLRDDKDHDRFLLGLTHAGTLIRRKSSFGREVSDHAEELASILCHLQDSFDTDGFEEYKLQALIAVLLSDVEAIAPWLSRQAFVGEYSLAQRCHILSALGLGGRELAGFKDHDELNPIPSAAATAFPSKRLPARLHAIYSPTNPSVQRLESASAGLEHRLIQPMALAAADETTAHLNPVKVRTFSSRLQKQRAVKASTTAPSNRLAPLFASAFFHPLLSRYQQDLAAYGAAGSLFRTVPFLLVTFLKTLALLLHAAGPATLHRAEISTAFWELLLALRVPAAGDLSVLEAVLFAALVVLEVNAEGRVGVGFVRENLEAVVEMRGWVEVVFERSGGGNLVVEGGGGSEVETKVRTLAAAVLVKIREFVEDLQGRVGG